jgi:hypothetical protein
MVCATHVWVFTGPALAQNTETSSGAVMEVLARVTCPSNQEGTHLFVHGGHPGCIDTVSRVYF